LEKVYVGTETDEINKMPLFYSAQYARDCLESGQPVRFLGRDYFTEGKADIEIKSLSWIRSICSYHKEVGEKIRSYLQLIKKP